MILWSSDRILKQKQGSQTSANCRLSVRLKMEFHCYAAIQLWIVSILIKEGKALETSEEMMKAIYPTELDELTNLQKYDELPNPIPFGPSVWYQLMLSLAISWCITQLLRYLLRKKGAALDLFPKTQCFPKLYVHWLQQTKRECDLRREAKNTWAYTAKKLLMSPDDPLVNIEEACSTGGQEFQRHKDIWKTVKMVVIANAMLKHIKDQTKAKKNNASEFKSLEKKHIAVKPLKRLNTLDNSSEVKLALDKIYQEVLEDPRFLELL